ncbi:Glutamate racemase [subsurface metagenome]
MHNYRGFIDMKKFLYSFIFLSMTVLFFPACENEDRADSLSTSLTVLVKSGESDLFPVAYDRYRHDTRTLPIGVFDSGIGGLTVLAEILSHDRFNNVTHESGPDGIPDFENERFIYLGDQANMPYGNYSSENKTEFLRELIIKDAVFLLGNRYWLSGSADSPRYDKPPVKAIVIACNTATAYGIDHIRAALEQWELPVHVIGVVEAGAEGGVAVIENNGEGALAVMATVGTCSSEGYVRAVEKSSVRAGIPIPQVIQQGCLGLAGAIEGDATYISPESKRRKEYKGPSVDNPLAPIHTELLGQYSFNPEGLSGDTDDPASWQINSVNNYIRYHTAELVERYRKAGGIVPIRAVILGCTHFPFHSDKIAASFSHLRAFTESDGTSPYSGIIAADISFIDPAALTASRLYEALIRRNLLLTPEESPVIAVNEFFISVPNRSNTEAEYSGDGTFSYAYKYGRNPSDLSIEFVRRVPMSQKNISTSIAANIRKTMPVVWEHLVRFNTISPRCGDLPDSAKMITPGR